MKNNLSLALILFVSILTLSSCGMKSNQSSHTQGPTTTVAVGTVSPDQGSKQAIETNTVDVTTVPAQ